MNSLLKELKKIGIRKVISCPGGRNKPLLDLFHIDKEFDVESFFDERSASFYALGLATQGSPVVVVVTSGSAVAECLPAVIEAKYQNNLPLVILSADRPKDLRFTGAPQTIPQNNIFGNFVESSYDIHSVKEELNLSEINYPAHINICLGEPNPLKLKEVKTKEDGVVILSQLKAEDREEVRLLLKDYKGFLVLEALSNFKENDFKSATVVKCADYFFNEIGLNSFKKIIRIGMVPVLKCWREIDSYESYYLEGYVSGSVKSVESSFDQLKSMVLSINHPADEILGKHLKVKGRVDELMKKHPRSEVSLLKDLIDSIPLGRSVFIGNSLPIREIQYANFDRGLRFIGQRGVNGIDGSLSFALGALDLEDEAWIIVGDLTCLYDMQGFWSLIKKSNKKIRIVVINNFGGQIFKKIFNKDYMLNSHTLDFSFLAKFWGIDYIKELNSLNDLNQRKVLIEVTPDAEQSQNFWSEH